MTESMYVDPNLIETSDLVEWAERSAYWQERRLETDAAESTAQSRNPLGHELINRASRSAKPELPFVGVLYTNQAPAP